MPTPICYSAQITPKQKKDLLGIYQDYLYFERGLELVLTQHYQYRLADMFMEQINWSKGNDLRWQALFATPEESDDYIRFVNGDINAPKQYAYMSLYHTQKDQDVKHKKISEFPKDYTYATIDLSLPCPIERYAVSYPKGQKVKDMNLIIDGLFTVTFNKDFKDQEDMDFLDAIADYKAQKEFKVMLSLIEYYHKNMYELELNHADDFSIYVSKIMMKMMANEMLADFENKVLDLIGSYADKTQEILHVFYPNTTTKDLWQIAEKNGLIASAENMQHYLNIRHLIRHQWDSLDGTDKFAYGKKPKSEQKREEYMASYHLLFDKNISDRIKDYQKITMQFQPLLKVLYPEFLTREVGESNSKFSKRIKQWLKDNPDKTPLINGNYLLKDEHHASLVSNLKKIAPNAIVLDDKNTDELSKFSSMESSYHNRTDFLKTYNHLESDLAIFCKEQGVLPNPLNIWRYLRANIINDELYKKWVGYRKLRNNLSHNHFNEELRAELDTTIEQFNQDVVQIYQNMENFRISRKTDEKQTEKPVVYKEPKKTNYRGKKTPPKDFPVKLGYWNDELIDCRFKNGITIDIKRKKVILPDNTRIYFDAKDFNVFRFENGNKLFTDKTFIVTKFMERGRTTPISRNENSIVAPKHKIHTDGRKRIAEESIIQADNQKLINLFSYDSNGAVMTLPDGTKLKTSAKDFIISHNDVVLTYDNRFAFKQSYVVDDQPSPTPPSKPPFSR